MVNTAISQLIAYALEKRLISPCERTWAVNALLEVLQLDEYQPVEGHWMELDLESVLAVLLDDALSRHVIREDSIVYRDLFDTMLMGHVTPRPRQVTDAFWEKYRQSPQAATDWYYQFSQDTNYIRKARIARDLKWVCTTEYGNLDVTINLSKPEKDPKAIAAARNLPPAGYPKCPLCKENEGYAGRTNHPARQNHRVIPINIHGSAWFMQYSPYVYYNEHCIVINQNHIPMVIDRACFEKLLDFIQQFPHYFVGSNADLPIVGGSILSHDHFQGGRYAFAMEQAPIETPVSFPGFEVVSAGIVKWPMSVIRLTSADRVRLADLAEHILTAWRNYSDPDSFLFAHTNGHPHNTVTPIARMRGGQFELDLVLRNNITTEEYPLGVYHPHSELHHIKKENIGLIEVMGLAVLPARLKEELEAVAYHLSHNLNLRGNPLTEKHATWAEQFAPKHAITPENALDIVRQETGLVFAKVLEHAGVYRRTPEGARAFLRFLSQV